MSAGRSPITGEYEGLTPSYSHFSLTPNPATSTNGNGTNHPRDRRLSDLRTIGEDGQGAADIGYYPVHKYWASCRFVDLNISHH